MGPFDWMYLRGNLRMMVAAHCPHCDYLIAEWPEGGMVTPPDLLYGEWVCPRCKWVSREIPNRKTEKTSVKLFLDNSGIWEGNY